MNKEKFLKNLIEMQYPNIKVFSKEINIPYTTVRTILEKGIGNARVDNLLKICDGLNIQIEDLYKKTIFTENISSASTKNSSLNSETKIEQEIIIGSMIRYFMKRDKITMKQLGQKLGKTESTVSKWVSGNSTPMAKDLSKMTHIFNTDIYTLMYGIKQNKETLSEINEISSKLTPERQNNVLDFAKYQHTTQQNNGESP
ncbi:helix-turn-helix domain-containing protein [Staphylococcus xylosus]